MSADELARNAVDADLASARFRAGVMRGHWRQASYDFPILIVAVAAVEPDGKPGEYFFRFELTGFPGALPEVKIWDVEANALLAKDKRPKGSGRILKAFQSWGSESVYRPWDRHAAGHNNFASTYPDLAWHPKRDLTFILEDIHGLLTSNAAACSNRPTA